jgi:hypothetical protein
MRFLVVTATWLVVTLLVLGAAAVLAQEGDEMPAIGSDVDAFLLLALPLMVLAQTAIIQLLKWVAPNTVVPAATLARVVKGAFALVYIGAWTLGSQDQLVSGVTFLNEFSEPLLRLLGLVGLWLGPSAVYEWAENRSIPVLGQRQGDVTFGYARNQEYQQEYQRAA